MKLILTGATGLIGGGVLRAALAHPSIDSILVLSRRAIPDYDSKTHPKLTTVIISDFTSYPPEVRAQIRDADAAVWCLGTPQSGMDVHRGYTEVAVKTMLEECVKGKEGRKFRFVYTSGLAVEKDQEKTLWFVGKMRKQRGTIEMDMVKVQEENAPGWETFIARPGMVTKGESLMRFVAPKFYIPVDILGAAMVDVAINGGPQFCENEWMKTKGKAVLAKK